MEALIPSCKGTGDSNNNKQSRGKRYTSGKDHFKGRMQALIHAIADESMDRDSETKTMFFSSNTAIQRHTKSSNANRLRKSQKPASVSIKKAFFKSGILVSKRRIGRVIGAFGRQRVEWRDWHTSFREDCWKGRITWGAMRDRAWALVKGSPTSFVVWGFAGSRFLMREEAFGFEGMLGLGCSGEIRGYDFVFRGSVYESGVL